MTAKTAKCSSARSQDSTAASGSSASGGGRKPKLTYKQQRELEQLEKDLADLAEEVARFYGYDNIPTTLPKGEATTGKLSFKLRVEEVARDIKRNTLLELMDASESMG